MSNIILVSIDDLFSLGAWPMYRDVVSMPSLDAFNTRATEFQAAYAEVALCNPSRSAVVSGQSPWVTGIVDNTSSLFDVVPQDQILFSKLKQAGYDITIGGKVFHALEHPVIDQIADRKLAYTGHLSGPTDDSTTVGSINYGPSNDVPLRDTQLANEVSNFLTETHQAPFALAAGLFRPHSDWIVPQEYFDLYPLADIEVPYFGDDTEGQADFYYALTGTPFHQQVVSQDAWKVLIQAYLASVSYADAMFGQMIDALDSSAYADNTHVVVFSDHGYHLGDQGVWSKFTLWEQSARAPLIIREAGQTEAKIVTTPVSLGDIYPTVLALAGIDQISGVSGQSLLPLTSGDPTEFNERPAITWMYGGISLRNHDYRYTRYEDGTEEFHDIPNDPNQLTNLIDDPALQSTIDAARNLIPIELGDRRFAFGAEADGILVGTDGKDILVSGPNAAWASGGAGDDIFVMSDGILAFDSAGGGHDLVYGEGYARLTAHVEDLVIKARTGEFTAFGNAGDNTILISQGTFGKAYGGAGNDTIEAYSGRTTIDAGTGNDYIESRASRAIINGAAGDDEVLIRAGVATVFGGAGDDILTDTRGHNTLDGGDGSDTLSGGTGNDVLMGGNGDDHLFGQLGSDERLYGGAGNDDLRLGNGDGKIGFGEDGNDKIVASTIGTDISRLYGGAGQDKLLSPGARIFAFGGDGGDSIYGNTGADRLMGGNGNDTVLGEAENDSLLGGAGADSIYGGAGADSLVGEGGKDLLKGGGGHDKVLGGGRSDFLYGGGGKDQLFGGGGKDQLSGGGGKDQLVGGGKADRVYGGGGKDKLDGNGGKDILDGGGGKDILDGGGGKDRLKGGGGKDQLTDGRGRDVLFGGAGADLFDFVKDNKRDVIRDWDSRDRINVGDWGPFIRFEDLTIKRQKDGDLIVSYRRESIEVDAKKPLTVSDLTADDFSFF